MDVSETTVKFVPLLAPNGPVTTTFPVVAPEGTDTVICVLLQPVGTAGKPLNVTVPVSCEEPNPVPVITILVPVLPETGKSDVILGVPDRDDASRVNATSLLATP